jgi:hypothetical protein
VKLPLVEWLIGNAADCELGFVSEFRGGNAADYEILLLSGYINFELKTML